MVFSIAAAILVFELIDLAGRMGSEPVVLAIFGLGLFLCGVAYAQFGKLRETDTTVSGGGLTQAVRIKAAEQVPKLTNATPEEVASN